MGLGRTIRTAFLTLMMPTLVACSSNSTSYDNIRIPTTSTKETNDNIVQRLLQRTPKVNTAYSKTKTLLDRYQLDINRRKNVIDGKKAIDIGFKPRINIPGIKEGDLRIGYQKNLSFPGFQKTGHEGFYISLNKE